MNFQYKKYGDGFLRPVIPIDFFHASDPKEKITFEVLVDSGADESFLPAEVADVIGLDLESGEPTYFIGATGVEKQAFRHKVTIAVGGHEIKTKILFTHALPPEMIGVVGQYGFFNFFVIKFDLKKRQLELRLK